jgi:hypothetical protein
MFRPQAGQQAAARLPGRNLGHQVMSWQRSLQAPRALLLPAGQLFVNSSLKRARNESARAA